MSGKTRSRVGGRATPTRSCSSGAAVEVAIDLMVQIHRKTSSDVSPPASVDGAC